MAGIELLHQRIAQALGWPIRDVTSFSLSALRELVRPLDVGPANEISHKIEIGKHVTIRSNP